VFPHDNTNRAKSVEFALVGVLYVYYMLCFSRGSYIWLARPQIFEVEIKINLHTWLNRYLE